MNNETRPETGDRSNETTDERGRWQSGTYISGPADKKDFWGWSWLHRLGELARQDLQESAPREFENVLGKKGEQEPSELVRRLERIREIMGEVQFREATLGLEPSRGLIYLRQRNEGRDCPNYDGAPHKHERCREALEFGAIDVPSNLKRWPDLTTDQARLILEGWPFEGMTLDQAKTAFRNKLHLLTKNDSSRGTREIWAGLLDWWCGDNALLLTFVDGKLVEIVDLDLSDSSVRRSEKYVGAA